MMSRMSSREPGSWGYSRAETPEELQRLYTELMAKLSELPMLSGYCYTQLADTYQETNGLLYADRTPKFPLEKIAAATARPTGYEHVPGAAMNERHEAPP